MTPYAEGILAPFRAQAATEHDVLRLLDEAIRDAEEVSVSGISGRHSAAFTRSPRECLLSARTEWLTHMEAQRINRAVLAASVDWARAETRRAQDAERKAVREYLEASGYHLVRTEWYHRASGQASGFYAGHEEDLFTQIRQQEGRSNG